MSKVKCKECGMEFIKNFHQRIFCSKECRLKYHARETTKYRSTEEYKKLNSDYYKSRLTKEFKEHKKQTDRLRYDKNKEKIKEKRTEWILENREKIRESVCLRLQFKTSKVPLDVKKKWALIHIANRINNNNPKCKPMEKNKIKKIIKKIQEGETHEAYKY